MGDYANAVLIACGDDFRWVVDSAAVTAFGDRVEAFLSVGEVTDTDVVDKIGDEFLASRSTARVSTVIEVEPTGSGDVPGVDFDQRETVVTPAGTVECVGITYDWSADNEDATRKVPEFQTRLDVRRSESARAVDQLITRSGGRPAVTAPALDLGTAIPSGKVGEVNVPPWSWSDADRLDDDVQVWRAETPLRLYRWSVSSDDTDATGDSIFEFEINGTGNGLLNITLGASDSYVEKETWGYFVMYKGDVLHPFCSTNGGHKTGTIQFLASDIV